MDEVEIDRLCRELAGNDDNAAREADAKLCNRLPYPLDRTDALERILFRADVLWLGMDNTLSPAMHRRQVLAAQFHYLDGAPVDEIIDLLPPPAGDSPLTPSTLDDWLRRDSVIRALAYNEIFYTNGRLAWHLLGKVGPVRAAELDALTDATSGKGVALSPEAALILWRYRYGMRPDDILTRTDCGYDCETLRSMLANLEQHLPFSDRMENLLARLTPVLGAAQVGKILTARGLWQRLAFQYHYVEDLTLNDVYQRLQAAARKAGCDVTQGDLHDWLCGKQLIKRL